MHEGDLSDSSSFERFVDETQPDEIYNLAAMSHVRVSFEIPEYTGNVDGIGVLRLLEAMRKNCPHSRFYQASTSELYGKVQQIPQSEINTFLSPLALCSRQTLRLLGCRQLPRSLQSLRL